MFFEALDPQPVVLRSAAPVPPVNLVRNAGSQPHLRAGAGQSSEDSHAGQSPEALFKPQSLLFHLVLGLLCIPKAGKTPHLPFLLLLQVCKSFLLLLSFEWGLSWW